MKKTNSILYVCIVLGAAIITSCGGSKALSFIKINPEETGSYTNPTLRKFMQDNEGAAVIVRDLAGRTSDKVQDASLSQATNTARICQLLEQGLLKNAFNVRDRQLFETVADKTDKNTDYVELYNKTGVDIIFEITRFNSDRYEVNYYYQGIAQKQFDPKNNAVVHDLYGYSIEIKVIMLQNNIVGGTYKYYYTPCDATQGGCLITQIGKKFITYIPQESAKPETLGSDNSFLNLKKKKKDTPERIAKREQSEYEMFEKTISKFITNTVIPGIVSDIKGR
jgi:hypothetical protein